MTGYLLLKTLHILASTLLLGTALGSVYYTRRAWRSGEMRVIATTFRHLVSAGWLFIVTSAIFQPLSGLALAKLAGWPLSQWWLLWSAGLFVFAGLCWLPVLWLQLRVRDLASQALRDGSELPEQARRYMRIWLALGWPALLALIAIFWLMMTKPL